MITLSRFTILLLLTPLLSLVTYAIYAEDSNSRPSNEITINAEPISTEITEKYGAHRHWFNIPDSTPLTILVESSQAPLSVWIATLEGDPLRILSPSKNGQYLYSEKFANKAGLYQIGVGVASNVSPPVRYRLGIYASDKDALPLDPELHIDSLKGPGTYRDLSFSEARSLYFNHHARFFRLSLENAVNRWVVATASANSFMPRVRMFSLTDQALIGDGWYNLRRKSSQHTAKLDGSPVGIIVYAHDTDPTLDPTRLGGFTLDVALYEHDPNRFFYYSLLDFFSNPLISLVTGILAGSIFSLVLYYRSIAGKRLLYQLTSDRLVLNSETTRRSQLSVMRNGKPVTDHVGVCNVQVRLGGHRDLRHDDISDPLRLCFHNVAAILRVTAEATAGWSDISVISSAQPTVQLGLRHLKPGDHISLDMFYIQKKIAEVVVKPLGQIYDGLFCEDRANYWKDTFNIAVMITGAVG